MTRPLHIDLDQIAASVRAGCQTAIASGLALAETDADRALIRTQERAVELQVALQVWMAREFMAGTPIEERIAVVANLLYSFCSGAASNEDDDAEDLVFQIGSLVLKSLRGGAGHLNVQGSVNLVEGGNA